MQPGSESHAGCGDSFWNIAASDRPAFINHDESIISYERLGRDVAAFAARLAQAPGLIGIYCDGHYRQYVAYLAALNARCPVVLMQPGQRPDRTGLSLSYLYSPSGDGLSALEPDAPPAWHPDLAVLLSTSGSTGAAKWVRLSAANIEANARSIALYLALTGQDCAPMALPFQYSYGMSIVNSHLSVGASLVLTDGSVVDGCFWDMFERAGCTSLAGVPHSFELMELAGIRTDRLGTLRYVTQAGGRLAPSQVRAWVERGKAEGWDFFVMYGQTEAAPRIAYLPPNMALETPTAIGVAVPGGEIWVAGDDGAPLPDGLEGELCYRGPNVMMGYATCDADLARPCGSDVLLTGDIARRLANGAFEIVGRKSRFVKLFGLRISLDEVETHLREAGVPAACSAMGDMMHVLVSREAGEPVSLDRVRGDIVDWLKIPGRSFEVRAVDALPRRENGKLDYQAVAALIAADETPHGGRLARIAAQARLRLAGLFFPSRRHVMDVFHAHFPGETISADASFNALGGDSLSYVSVAIELESLLGSLPQHWAEMTIAELQASAGQPTWLATIDTATLVRALAIMLIAAGHLHVFDYGGGGAYSLFAVAGMSFAAFSLPQVLESERVSPIWILALRIIVLAEVYRLIVYAITGYGDWRAFLFHDIWISPNIAGSIWFVSVYLELLLGVILILRIPAARRAVRNQPFESVALAATIFVLIAAVSDALVDTNYLYRRLPHLLAWIFLTGALASMARSFPQRLCATAILLAGMWQNNGLAVANYPFFVLAAFALIWLPALPVPRILLPPLRTIAGASLIIYLSHFNFGSIAERLSGGNAALAWLLAMVGGCLMWRLYCPVDAWISRMLYRLFTVPAAQQAAIVRQAAA